MYFIYKFMLKRGKRHSVIISTIHWQCVWGQNYLISFNFFQKTETEKRRTNKIQNKKLEKQNK